MTRWTPDELREGTLRRQFRRVEGRGPEAVVELFAALGPVQSQVPRAPFLAAASRLPGTTYATVCALFEEHRLVKATNLRGTVHTAAAQDFAALDAVSSSSRNSRMASALTLDGVTPQQVNDEVRRFCHHDWQARNDIVAHMRSWLTELGHGDSAARLTGTFAESLVWGDSGLLRRPRDGAWETRTDSFHRTASSLLGDPSPIAPAQALVGLVRRHLAAYGPLTRGDLAFFFGVGLGQVDAAVAALGDEVERATGPEGRAYLDLADGPPGETSDPGCRLLGEFDGLLLGFSGAGRTRFLSSRNLERVWAKTNGMFLPVVLYEGHLVATWRTLSLRGRTEVEVRLLDSGRPPPEDLLAAAAADVGLALARPIAEVRVLPPGLE